MKKNLLTAMFMVAFVFCGLFVTNAEASTKARKNVTNPSKISTANEIKLKKIQSLLNKVEMMRKQNCLGGCTTLLLNIIDIWNQTQIICGISGWDSGTCNNWIGATLGAGDVWARAGCDTGGGFVVTASNMFRNKVWMNRKESIQIV